MSCADDGNILNNSSEAVNHNEVSVLEIITNKLNFQMGEFSDKGWGLKGL
jgi:hypothetical protein